MDLCVDWGAAGMLKLFPWLFHQAILPFEGLMSRMQLRDHSNGGNFGKKRRGNSSQLLLFPSFHLFIRGKALAF